MRGSTGKARPAKVWGRSCQSPTGYWLRECKSAGKRESVEAHLLQDVGTASFLSDIYCTQAPGKPPLPPPRRRLPPAAGRIESAAAVIPSSSQTEHEGIGQPHPPPDLTSNSTISHIARP